MTTSLEPSAEPSPEILARGNAIAAALVGLSFEAGLDLLSAMTLATLEQISSPSARTFALRAFAAALLNGVASMQAAEDMPVAGHA
jgi:hypothetical protein